MIKKIQNFCFKNKLFSSHQSLVVGISGGPDSTALLCFLARLEKSWRLKIHLVHINYALRGKDSEKDEKFCRALAEKLSLPLTVVKYQKEKKASRNLEERLRDFRYAVFEKKRQELGFDWIAVGHTLDDQIETFLFNLMRGSGLEGLVSLKPKNNRVIRPLLGLEKKEVLVFLKSIKQSFRLDKSNQELKFTRNKIRKKLLPQLEKEYNPQIKKSLAGLQEYLADVVSCLNKEVEEIYFKIVEKKAGGRKLRVENYLSLPRIKRRKIFRLIIEDLLGGFKNFSISHFWEMEKIVFSQKPKRQIFSGKNFIVKKEGKYLIFEKKQSISRVGQKKKISS